MIYLIMGVIC